MFPRPVQHVQMMVVAVGFAFLGIDILAEGRLEQRSLQIMRRQGIAGQDRIDVTILDQRNHRLFRIGVKDNRRPEHPDNITVFLFIAQQFIQPVIIAGIRRLAGAAGPEGESVAIGRPGTKPVRMDQNSFAAVFRASDKHFVADCQPPEFLDFQPPVRVPDHDSVHAALGQQRPLAVNFVVFRENSGRVIVLRRHAGFDNRFGLRIRAGNQFRRGEIRFRKNRHLEFHVGSSWLSTPSKISIVRCKISGIASKE